MTPCMKSPTCGTTCVAFCSCALEPSRRQCRPRRNQRHPGTRNEKGEAFPRGIPPWQKGKREVQGGHKGPETQDGVVHDFQALPDRPLHLRHLPFRPCVRHPELSAEAPSHGSQQVLVIRPKSRAGTGLGHNAPAGLALPALHSYGAAFACAADSSLESVLAFASCRSASGAPA